MEVTATDDSPILQVKQLNGLKAALKRETGVDLKYRPPTKGAHAHAVTGAPLLDLASVNWGDAAGVPFVPDGVLAVYKPRGLTSSDVVTQVRG